MIPHSSFKNYISPLDIYAKLNVLLFDRSFHLAIENRGDQVFRYLENTLKYATA